MYANAVRLNANLCWWLSAKTVCTYKSSSIDSSMHNVWHKKVALWKLIPQMSLLSSPYSPLHLYSSSLQSATLPAHLKERLFAPITIATILQTICTCLQDPLDAIFFSFPLIFLISFLFVYNVPWCFCVGWQLATMHFNSLKASPAWSVCRRRGQNHGKGRRTMNPTDFDGQNFTVSAV